jgi:hypothetical protein
MVADQAEPEWHIVARSDPVNHTRDEIDYVEAWNGIVPFDGLEVEHWFPEGTM